MKPTIYIEDLARDITDNKTYKSLSQYLDLAHRYADFVAEEGNIQVIHSQTPEEHHYVFYQYQDESIHYKITRPINSQMMVPASSFEQEEKIFLELLSDLGKMKEASSEERKGFNNMVYTIQQSIGATLDSLNTNANSARKINGNMFENLIRLLFQNLGLDARTNIATLKLKDENNQVVHTMKYQQDLVLKQNGQLKLIGDIKTSSKDRFDKVFMDAYFYNKIADAAIPHIAVFLNDVQRSKTKKRNQYRTSSTFCKGRFIGYSIGLDVLSGVYYCDKTRSMEEESYLQRKIKTLDCLYCEDIFKFLKI